MVAVHDGTANINKRNVVNVNCVNCMHCIAYEDGYYICCYMDNYEAIEECIANDENQLCDVYEPDCNDDFTERS